MRVRIGVSACLLGARVRYDGDHKRDAFLADELGPLVEWVAVCPEVEVGMGVPRESVRLVRGPARGGPRMLGVDSGRDWTRRMNRYAEARARGLARARLSGYVLKSRSPSCGMEGVKLFAGEGPEARAEPRGVGLFAAALRRRLPNLPVEEEGRLGNARLRACFLERVLGYARIQELWRGRWTPASLAAFHADHEGALRARSAAGCRALGRLVAQGGRLPRAELRARYEAGFMRVLGAPAPRRPRAGALARLTEQLRDRA
jgi:uncharacterized protein YbbK (DUF523 family)